MIVRLEVEHDSDEKWLLRPTRSMNWREAKAFIAIVAVVSFAIGGLFFWWGYPLVLPFSGLEVVAIAVAFYVVLRDGEQREVISIIGNEVVIEKGRTQADVRTVFERAWARVELRHSPRRWYPSRLLISSHGRATELGHFLTNGEREALAKTLINAIKKNR